MGKHKDKRSKKSKKNKKNSKRKRHSSDSSDSSGDLVWTEKTNSPNVEQTTNDNDTEKNLSESKDAPDDSSWFNLLATTSTQNVKASQVEKFKRKEEVDKVQNKIRYGRELNSFFRDDENKRFIEEPEKFWKKKEKQQIDESTPSKVVDNNTRLTDAERNAINAKIIKAEIMGDNELVSELKKKLKNFENQPTEISEYLTKKKSKSGTASQEEKMSVKEMYLQTKSSISSYDETMRFVASSSKLRATDDEYEDLKTKKQKLKLSSVGFEKLKEDQGGEAATCGDCLEKHSKHLLLRFASELKHCFVAFTTYEPFVTNYFQIRSKSHHTNCTLTCDEDCWTEIRQVMRKLASFFDQSYNCTLLFMETHFIHQKRDQNLSRKHFVIECVPIKKRLESDAYIFFNKAILECEEEWSMNKKLIKLEGNSITRKLPKGLPYFWVSFGPDFDGFAHVIEDEDHFRKDFGKEIIGGLYDIDPHKWTKPRPENYDGQFKRMKELKNKWREFD